MRGRRGRRATAAIIAGLALATGLTGTAAARQPERCNGEAALCDRPLERVVLPAAHNAMSARSLGWQIPNQQVAVPEQLALGIRGLLIDTYYGHRLADGTVVNDPAPTAGSELFLCHVLCQLGATPLQDALGAIRAFLEAHPDNVLVIVNEDGIAPEDFAGAVRRSGLLRHVYKAPPPGPGRAWPTLRQLIVRRQQVVMLAERDASGVSWYHEAYDGILQETPYTWPEPGLLTDPARWEASCRPNRGGETGSLFLLNHWSPPFAPDPAVSAQVNAPGVIAGRAATCARVRGRVPNLLAVDMVLSGDVVAAARWLNATLGAAAGAR
jgi:hypothetical protein